MRGAGSSTQEDPIGLAGGLNLYGYANGDPINRRDPFGLSADTLDVEPSAQPQVDNCRAKSATCKALLDSLDASSEYWVIRKGELPKFCRDQGFIGGCTYWSPVPGHGAGGSITFDPAQFDRVGQIIGVIMNSVAAISHELGHAVSCDVSELCARASENRARQDAGLPRRP